jgi:hypothetical protein
MSRPCYGSHPCLWRRELLARSKCSLTKFPNYRLADVNAIWNANAFFAYILTVKVFNLPWERRKLGAVTLATGGVLIVLYGGTTIEHKNVSSSFEPREGDSGPTAPVLGDLLTLVASVGVASYQVLYKKYAAQSTDPEHDATLPAPMPSEGYESLANSIDLEDGPHERPESDLVQDKAPRSLPFGLFPNFLTSGIGFITFFVLWTLIPVFNWLGIEEFRAPPDAWTALTIAVIALTGVVFNAGLMVSHPTWHVSTTADRFAAVDTSWCLGPSRR